MNEIVNSKNMKTMAFRIIVIVFLSISNNVFSSTVHETQKTILHQGIQNNTYEEAQSYYEKGLTFQNIGEYLPAEEAFLEAVELAEKSQEKEILAYSFHYLGNIESWKSNFSQSIQYNKKARSLFLELDNSEYEAISNNQISIAFGSLGEYDSTLVYFQYNIQNRELIDAKYTVLNSYQKIAGTYAKLFNYKLAYRYLQEGIEYAEKAGSKQSLGELYFTAGHLFLNNHVNKDIALEYLLEAQSIFEETKNYRYLNFVKLSIGDVYFKTENDSIALELYQEVSTSLYPDDYAMLSVTDHKIAMVFKGRKDYDNALRYLQKSIDGMCLVCPEIQIHQTLIEAARTYLIIGNSEQALSYLNRAKNIAIKSESSLEMAICYEELGNYYQTLNNPDSSIYYLELAHQLDMDLGLPERVKNTAELLSEKHYSKGEFQTSSNYLKIANLMNDSLASIEKYNEVAKLEMRFEIEKKEKERKLEAQLLQSEITKQKFIRNTLVAGAVVFSIIGIVLLRAYRSKRKDNQILAKQKAEIQEVSKQLQESGKRKLDFFTNISHEIRTPLTLIKSPLERILKRENKEDEIDSQLQIALNNTNKLKELVNQILDLQKLDENLLGLNLSNFELISFCKEVVSSFEGYFYQSNCNFDFESNVSEVIINFDKVRLQSIINNLLSNAIKFNKENGLVHFKLDVNRSQIKLEIKDTGKGISSEHLNKLGERYYQIEKSNSSVEGTGIGLAYVKELVQLMKGNFEISSIENKGTSVTISLPCDEIVIQAEAPFLMKINVTQQVFDQLEEQLSENPNNLPSILIIEDNHELRLFLQDLFAPSYQIICAKDGNEGKEMALKHLPDLIISDVMMPGIKGNELCKILKNDINASHITIILFTAKGAPDSIVDGYDSGADDYIVKPFNTDILVKKVQNIISTKENARKQFSFTAIERTSTTYSEFDKKLLKDCMTIVKENLNNSSFTVESLAENVNLHRRTLLRKFNSLTGKSPIDLIRHTRMTQAAKLLQEKHRVSEVSILVGYEDTNRFSQAFKQFHGISPSAYN
jgi:signal transduction histidine kinase/DNA-binding response OmpR family regulator